MNHSVGPKILLSAAGRKLIAAFAIFSALAVGTYTVPWKRPRTIAPLAVFKGHAYEIHAVAFAPDARTLASTGSLRGRGAELKLLDVDSVAELGALSVGPEAIESVAFSPNGKTLASSGTDGMVRLWDVDGQRQRAIL